MGSQPRIPVLPHGATTTLSGFSETFSFHSSPESFITSRVLAFQASNPSLANSRTSIRAKVLNRNVAVLSSYGHIKQVLCDKGIASSLSAAKAYDELMASFFPPPNLLLADPPAHGPMKDAWKSRMAALPDEIQSMARETVLSYFSGFTSGSTIDLYESMKELSWRLILGAFVPKSEAATIEALQEDLLRGQFSLFPISINAKLWRSPRSKGLTARKKLQSLLQTQMQNSTKSCPFTRNGQLDQNDIASHLLLFTSSLAVKSLASILTAILLNLFVYTERDSKAGDNLASKILSLPEIASSMELLKSATLETERLSPPVVGIMRRTTQDITLSSGQENIPDTLVPTGWDVWMYFVGASRDPAMFDQSADEFRPERYYHTSEKHDGPPKGLAFGLGPKSCLGEELVRAMVTTVAKTFLGLNREAPRPNASIRLEGNLDHIPKGVHGWLGWRKDVTPKEWAKDMKQLPTQRPVKAVMIRLVHNINNEPA